MERNYDASANLAGIVQSIEAVWKNGLKVDISNDKITVINTVRYQYDLDHGIDPKQDGFAYAEFKKTATLMTP
ncbi:MAG: hypothetical protein HDQ88_01235 [Clostridia bacterium]|nr:hypothetical protein [Clostridia bacterium]